MVFVAEMKQYCSSDADESSSLLISVFLVATICNAVLYHDFLAAALSLSLPPSLGLVFRCMEHRKESVKLRTRLEFRCIEHRKGSVRFTHEKSHNPRRRTATEHNGWSASEVAGSDSVGSVFNMEPPRVARFQLGGRVMQLGRIRPGISRSFGWLPSTGGIVLIFSVCALVRLLATSRLRA